ncbi:MAG: NACHT domain-containing protein, partial [Saccharothrix sp.]|nr:NACHT domain-containing protein [Saccharothrix sp.]
MDHRRLARTSRTIALIGAGGVTCLVLLPIAINAATGGSALRVLGPYGTWLWPSLVFLALITVGLAAWEPLSAVLVQRRPAHPANRVAVLDRVDRYVRARVDGSLAAQVRLKLGVVPRVGPALPTRIRVPLVVAGETGCGKTSLLLDLAGKLVERARADIGWPVPVVVDLGGWRPRQDFGEWLLHAVKRRYRIGTRLGRTWLREQRLTVLFDGLDELPAEHRAECLRWITALKLPQVVLTCSTDDYEHLPRYDVVHVEPLRRTDVLDLISACEPRLDGLHETLTKDPDLWDEVRTPLAFDLLALAHRAGRAEYHGGVPETYLVESVARSGRAERVVRALRFLARIARRRHDLRARHRLPHRRVWLDFVDDPVVWRLFRRAAPGALAGLLAGTCLVTGLELGLPTALAAAAAALALRRGRFDATTTDRRRGLRWAMTGAAAGTATGAALSTVGGWLGAQAARWPAAVTFGLVLVTASLITLALTKDRYWAVAGALAPTAVMIWTGPSTDLLSGLGTGLLTGTAAGLLTAGLAKVWRDLDRPAPRALHWLPLAGLPATALAAALGAPPTLHAAPITGLLIGLAVAPAIRPPEPVTALLAAPLALDEFPLRRKAIIQDARDRVLLVDDNRF